MIECFAKMCEVDMKYFVRGSEDIRYGPYDIDELNDLIKENRVSKDTILVNYETELEFQANSVLKFPKPVKILLDLPLVIEKQKIDLPPFVADNPQNSPSTSSDVKYDENDNKYETKDYIYIQQDTKRNMNFLLLLISYILILLPPVGLLLSIKCLNNAKKYDDDELPCIISLVINALIIVWIIVVFFIIRSSMGQF